MGKALNGEDLGRGIDQLPSGGYRARYRATDGTQHTAGVFDRLRDARDALARAKADLSRGEWVDPQRAGITLDVWWGRWHPKRRTKNGPLADGTRVADERRYKRSVQPWLGQVPLYALTDHRLDGWLSALDEHGASLTEQAKALTLLKTCLTAAVRDNRLRVNPAAHKQLNPPPPPDWRLLSRAEFDRLVDAVKEHYQPFVVTAGLTGMRWSELAGLRRLNLGLLRGEVTVVRDLAKSRRARTIPLVPRVVDALNAHLARTRPDPEGLVFLSPRGYPLDHSRFHRDVWGPATVKAGLEAVRFHDLRHSCCTWLLDEGAPPHRVMEIMGHAQITTTQRYIRKDPDALRDAMMRLA